MGRILSLEEAVEVADLYTRGTCKTILEAMEREECLDNYLRKIVLDAVNDLKRQLVRTIYDAE